MDKNIFRYNNWLGWSLQTALAMVMFFCMSNYAHSQQPKIMVRISEIEIYPEHLEKYKEILKIEAEASIRLEAGVIAIFPMFQKDKPTQIRILEMYKDQQGYQSHLKAEHFQKYKTGTLHMVKSLNLVDMEALDMETATQLFRKLKN
ncbi:putative quinol monooxygenase [Sphingobacterium sp. BIGb0165]|uniref:putative quinol monooxygenase n=1 Tax=Sphingobacterium sp. BIGb0165 TaxID=2940615 RepID=UPI00216A4020|nr:antibiotic biosynthesis monooxygenase [Sphingobacterium sp. BIGb0165]MCS4224595.1 quinol monooxygenase YgiN [Sphingobacterium sp. BIGb0165]